MSASTTFNQPSFQRLPHVARPHSARQGFRAAAHLEAGTIHPNRHPELTGKLQDRFRDLQFRRALNTANRISLLGCRRSIWHLVSGSNCHSRFCHDGIMMSE